MENGRELRRSSRRIDQENPKRHIRVVQSVNKTPSFTETFNGRLDWKVKHCEYPMTSTPILAEKHGLDHNSNRCVLANNRESNLTILSPIKKLETENTRNLRSEQRPTSTSVSHTKPLVNHTRQTKQILRIMPENVSKENEDVIVVTEAEPIRDFKALVDKYGDDDDKGNNGDQSDLRIHLEPVHVKTYKAVKPAAPVRDADFETDRLHIPLTGEQRKARQNGTTSSKSRLEKSKRKRAKGCGEGTVQKSLKVKPVKTKLPKLDADAIDWIRKTNMEFEEVSKYDLIVEKH